MKGIVVGYPIANYYVKSVVDMAVMRTTRQALNLVIYKYRVDGVKALAD